MSTKTTIRRLVAHNKLLVDVIRRQAGTLDKAILEGVMNSIEAGAKLVEIIFQDQSDTTPAKLIIRDDGRGIRSQKEIEDFFETFGMPHDESENKIWANFRMGRGQIFSFGKNVWRTGEFSMMVDIDKLGLEYPLESGLKFVNGCEITVDLYHSPFPRQYYSIDALQDAIRRQVEFMEVPVLFNGKQLNTPASKCKWTEETDNAYFLFGAGSGLSVYNLGAFVKTISASAAGVCGVVVSKKQLKVNFARNDVQHDCAVFQSIMDVVVANRRKDRKESRYLNDDERVSCICDLRDTVEEYNKVRNLGLFDNTSGRRVSLAQIRLNRIPWCFTARGDRAADKLMQAGQSLCLDDKILGQLNYSGRESEFFVWLSRRGGFHDDVWDQTINLHRPFDSLSSGLSRDHSFLDRKLWHGYEKRVIRLLESFGCWAGRALGIGLSDCYDGWTDGGSYIMISRSWLKQHYRYGSRVLALLCHELAHDDASYQTHIHGEEFYRRFHDIVSDHHGPMQYCERYNYRLLMMKKLVHAEEIAARESRKQAKRDAALGVGLVQNTGTQLVAARATKKKKKYRLPTGAV